MILNCEQTCPWASWCRYLACYMPWRQIVSFKSGSEIGYIVSHEFGHHLEKEGVIENGEPAAVQMEKWWAENMYESACEVCGDPLFVSEETEPGSQIVCEVCGSIYEAVNYGARPPVQGQGGIVISKKAYAAAAIGAPVLATVVGSFVMDRLPQKGLSKDENIHRTREFLGFLFADVAIAGLVTVLVT